MGVRKDGPVVPRKHVMSASEPARHSVENEGSCFIKSFITLAIQVNRSWNSLYLSENVQPAVKACTSAYLHLRQVANERLSCFAPKTASVWSGLYRHTLNWE